MPTISSPSSNLNLNLNLKWRWRSIWKCLKNAKNPAGWTLFPVLMKMMMTVGVDDDNCVDDDDTCLTRWRGLASWSKTQKHSRSMSLPCQPETYLQTCCYRQSLKILSLRHIWCISPNIFQNKFIYGKLIGVYANLTCIWQSGLTHIYNIGLVVCVQFEFLYI